MAEIARLYVGCGLTHAPESFREGVEQLKTDLRRDYEVSEFLGLVDGTAEDVYRQDILECVKGADFMVGLVDEPSTGLGWELASATRSGKPTLAAAHQDSKVSRLVLGAPAYNPSMEFAHYKSMAGDLPKLIRQRIKAANSLMKTVGYQVRMEKFASIDAETAQQKAAAEFLADLIETNSTQLSTAYGIDTEDHPTVVYDLVADTLARLEREYLSLAGIPSKTREEIINGPVVPATVMNWSSYKTTIGDTSPKGSTLMYEALTPKGIWIIDQLRTIRGQRSLEKQLSVNRHPVSRTRET